MFYSRFNLIRFLTNNTPQYKYVNYIIGPINDKFNKLYKYTVHWNRYKMFLNQYIH